MQLTSGTSSSNREEERPPEPITGFGSRAGTTTCDASGLGGFVRRYRSTRNLRIISNFFRSGAVPCTLCHTLYSVTVLSNNTHETTKKKKKMIVRCQCTRKLTQVSSFSEPYSGISFFCSKLCLKKLSTSASRIDFKLCMITLLA